MSFRTQLSQLKWELFSFLSIPLCLLPIKKNKIVFQNFSGRGYGDNPKYLAEAIISNHMDYELVWLCKDLTEDIPLEIRKVKYGTFSAYREMATAGIWVSNVWTGLYTPKRRDQFYLQTWHGSIALKKVEKAVKKYLNPEYVRVAKRMSKKCDLLISNATWVTEMYKRDFWYRGEILEKGLPRLDALYNTPDDVVKKVHQHFGIPADKKIVLYAPTFRKSERLDNYLFDFGKFCQLLEGKQGQDFVMLVRLHPNAVKVCNDLSFPHGVYNATHYPDMQELLAVSDTLITDYSSSMFEMGMVGKKVFLLTRDFEDYINNDRGGVLFDLQQLPFMLAKSEEELWENISNYNESVYQNRLSNFMKQLGIIETKTSAVEIIKGIERIRDERRY